VRREGGIHLRGDGGVLGACTPELAVGGNVFPGNKGGGAGAVL